MQHLMIPRFRSHSAGRLEERPLAASQIITLLLAALSAAACARGNLVVSPESPPALAVLYRNDFDHDPPGKYTLAELNADWRNPAWENGVAAGRVEIVGAPDAYAGHSLCVHYPAGGVGPSAGGAQWQLRLDHSYKELFCSYRIKFGPGFGFVKGGKIPGLAGGAANTGGNRPNGRDGWSARMMWREDGRAVQYVYHPDQPTIYGQDFPWDLGGQRVFKPGVWHSVEHRVVMNTPGARDGIVQGWFDGTLALDRRDVRFRDVDAFSIDAFYFSTFFGGQEPCWAPSRDERIDFDDVVVATGRS
jgi:hypothetical protein